MIPATELSLNDINKTVSPCEINATADLLFTNFNNTIREADGSLSKNIIRDWLLNFLQVNMCENKQAIAEPEQEKISPEFCWDYDDVNDLHLK